MRSEAVIYVTNSLIVSHREKPRGPNFRESEQAASETSLLTIEV